VINSTNNIPHPLHTKSRYIPWLIFGFAFFFYVFFRSISLDDWDSAQFALGVERFDIPAHSPHPPGYVFYIYAGKLLNIFFRDPVQSLTFISALTGALTILIFFFFVEMVEGRKPALLSSLILMGVPNFCLTSLKALTDMPGIFFIYLTLFLATRAYISDEKRYSRYLYLAALAAGVGIGFRPQSAFATILILTVPLTKKFKWTRLAIVVLILLLITFSYILIILVTHDGIGGYVRATYSQFMWRLDKPHISVLGSSFSPSYILHRLDRFARALLVFGFGMGKQKIYRFLIMIIMFSGWILFLVRVPGKKNLIVSNLPWMVCYVLMIMIFLPANPRYLCPVIPMGVLIAVLGWLSFRWGTIPLVMLLLCNWYFSFKLAKKIHIDLAPPEKAVRYIQRRFSEQEVTIFSRSIIRHLHFYLPSTWAIHNCFTNNDLLKALDEGQKVLTDFNPYDIFTEDDLQMLEITKLRDYDRDEIIHTKHVRSRIYLIEKKE